MSTITYAVPELSRGDGQAAIADKVSALPGVDRVDVRLEATQVDATG